MRRALPLAALVLAWLAMPGAGLAQQAGRPGLAELDQRRPVPVAAAPWSSLVRVQTEAGGRCTGVLIAPDRVLTAAHCLVAPLTRQVVRPDRVHVLAVYDRGEFRAHSPAVALRLGAGFIPANAGPPGADWAVLRLANPLNIPALPLADAPMPDTRAMLGGWQQDRAHALLADTDCRVLSSFRDSAGRELLRHGCAITRGGSGAPLLVRLPDADRAGLQGGWAVAGIAVSAAAGVRGGVAVALTAEMRAP